MDSEVVRKMGELRIGQTVTLKSMDAGVPETLALIWGLSISPMGNENICLGAEDGMCQADYYKLDDIRV